MEVKMKKHVRIKTVIIIFASIFALLVITGISFYIISDMSDKQDFSLVQQNINEKNHVKFRSNVFICESSDDIQKNFENISMNDKEYVFSYKKNFPEFYKKMHVNDIFCVYPDQSADESFFAFGFCGKLKAMEQNGDRYLVRFTIPELKEVFSDIYINTQSRSKQNTMSMAFYPSDHVAVSNLLFGNAPVFLRDANAPVCLTAIKQDKITAGDTTAGYKFKRAKEDSLLDDYKLICDELKLSVEHKMADDNDISIDGSVTLEDLAVKMLLDYHYNETTNAATINDYALGFIAKQKTDLKISGEKSLSLGDLNHNLTENLKVMDLEDVTKAEEKNGKIVLGTYLVGIEAALPILQNKSNDISYLSIGIAIQFTITAKGTLSMEFNIEESGFSQIEVNGNGQNTYLSKSPDYPNPAKVSRKPTEDEQDSTPEVTGKIKGEASFNMGFGCDIGLCILGMVPIKETNNFANFEVDRNFSGKWSSSDEMSEIVKNNYLLDDNVSHLMLSTNSYLKIHLGAKIKFGALKYTPMKADGSVLLFENVWFQSPTAIGFSHSQCGFGGVFVGEKYSDDELKEAFNTFMKDTGQDSIIASAKDSLFGSLINAAFGKLDFDPMDITSFFGGDADDYKINYFSSGVIYVRNKKDIVVGAFIMDEEILNNAGFHIGLSNKKVKQLYSAPAKAVSLDIKIRSFIQDLLGFDDINDMEYSADVYPSSDSKEEMNLLFQDDKLKLIIITNNR